LRSAPLTTPACSAGSESDETRSNGYDETQYRGAVARFHTEPTPLPPFPIVLETPQGGAERVRTRPRPIETTAPVEMRRLRLVPLIVPRIGSLPSDLALSDSGDPILPARTLTDSATEIGRQMDDRADSESKRQKIGLPCYSLLSITLLAGYTALPKVVNYFNAFSNVDAHAGDGNVIPVEIDLSAGFIFHTTFTCAVTMTQTSKSNLPNLLLCGHVISTRCLERLTMVRGRNFKCPMCRQQQHSTRVRQLCL